MVKTRDTTLAVLAAWLWSGTVPAAVTFDAVAAGDMTDSTVILWTRATDGDGPAKVTAQVATDPAFQKIVWTGPAATVPDNDFTVKLNATGLTSFTRYYYRFTADTTSETGRFTTAPLPEQNVTITFGITGDADGRFRPFPAIANMERHDLDFLIFNGDTIYETASGNPLSVSPAVPRLSPISTSEEALGALAAYNRKYRENILGVTETGATTTTGQRSLAPMLRATGIYTLLDNHELGNGALQAGGAPLALKTPRNPVATPEFDVNVTGTFHNQTLAFQTLEKAFFNHHPTRVDITGIPTTGLTAVGPIVDMPGDPRTHGTPRHFFAQRWGKQSLYIQLDDRSYRDARLGNVTGGELVPTDPRSSNPNRTILGVTQFEWLKNSLLQAKEAGITWKFIAISSPIDMVGGPPEGQHQDQKSWYGGYRAERNALLKFIADNAIDHVVFLVTDDHMARMTRLQYDSGGGMLALVPGAFQIVAGPIGAEGPDAFAQRDRGFLLSKINARVQSQAALGQPMDGIGGLPGLTNVKRDIDPDADTNRNAIDFLSPDTFNYAVLSVDPSGVLTVSVFGIASYIANRNFTTPPEQEHLIMSFQLQP